MNELTSLKAFPTPVEFKNFGLNREKEPLKADQDNNFTAYLKEAVKNLEQTLAEGNQASLALINGEAEDLHTPVIALEKANLSLGLAMTVRNKVINAYQEIMRMQM